jgi:hypothetical protein
MHHRAVSVSIGSSKRDKSVEIDLFGKTIQLERIGTDGDMKAAAQMYRDLDGKAGALGVGGAILGLLVDQVWYDLHSSNGFIQQARSRKNARRNLPSTLTGLRSYPVIAISSRNTCRSEWMEK